MVNRLSRSRWIAVVTAFQLLCSSGAFALQGPRGEPLGALSTRGEVYVNQQRVTGELTLYVGETVRTGADGVAGLAISGRGMLIISPQSEISFASTARYSASLARGTVGLHSPGGAQTFVIQVGNYVVVSVGGVEAAFEIERAADGSARVSCSSGEAGVIALEGPEHVFVPAGQTAAISAEGALLRVPPAAAPPSEPKPAAKKKSRSGLIILGVAGGGAAAAAATLASRGKDQPVSPSRP